MDNNESYPTIKDFVLQEAHEKSFETLVLGLKDYEKQKSRLVEEKKEAIHSDFEKRTKENNSSQRIHRSSLINSCRMNKMQKRHHYLTSIIHQAESHLLNKIVSDENKYRQILKTLIVEGLIKMLEPKVYVRCLPRDVKLAQSLVEECKSQFKDLVAKEGIDAEVGQVELVVDSRYTLRERQLQAPVDGQIEDHDSSEKCIGGVVLTNEDGLIVCKNTLDSRLQLAYQQMLPVVRRQLFN